VRRKRLSAMVRLVWPFGSPDHGCAGETVSHLLFLSQTSAGFYKLDVS
jgi:hypothetical protein